jgi:ketopantoate reductase
MLEDVTNHRKTEIDYLNGVVVELGKKVYSHVFRG